MDAVLEAPVDDGLMSEEQRIKQSETARAHRLQLLGGRLQAEFDQRVNDRRQVETRWFEDLRQYNGQYDPGVLDKIRQNEGSELFVNITRTKTDAVEARIADLVLPTDDRNWDIKPTPMPELGELESNSAQMGTTPQGAPMQVADMAIGLRETADKRNEAMRDTMDDQLAECRYNGVLRDVIHDGCVLGIGILKGPIIHNRTRKKWVQIRDERGNVAQVQRVVPDRRPVALRVDPWNFYPETGVVNIEDSESEFERHWLTRAQLRDLAKQPGFLQEEIRAVLLNSREAPNVTNDYRVQLRAIAGETSGRDQRYEVVEYTGPVEPDDLIAAGAQGIEADPLKEYHGNVWFMYGRVIKADVQPMESLEKAYHVWNWAKDDSTIFGRGVPRQMRTSQKMANSATRMIFDNAGLAVGGQLIYDMTIVTPADGKPRMTPKKVWQLTEEGRDVRAAFAVFETKLHLEWLLPLFHLAMQLADEESSLPMIAQGDQAKHITKTKGGMAMLMDAAGVMLRRAVKAFDDGITVPFITGMYNWNMEFNPKEEIKGDFAVQARGSSALMEREQQLAAFIQFTQFLQTNPLFAKVTRWDAVLEEGVRLLRVNRNLLEAPEKIAQVIKEMTENPPPPPKDPRVEVAEMNNQVKKYGIDRQAELEQARLALQRAADSDEFQRAMLAMATEAQISVQELEQMFGIKRMEIDNQNARFNAEALLRRDTGEGI
jgi:hypothetical protein